MNLTRRTWNVTLFASVGYACSSAHLDPTSRALTLSSPTSSPSRVASASASPSTKTHPKAGQARLLVTPRGALPEKQPATSMNSETTSNLPTCSNLPDPAPSRTDRWVALAVRMEKGILEITASSPRRSRRLETTKRTMGRFATELWIGCELIDRVRFDFPLLAAEPTTGKEHDPSFELAGRFEATVVVPDSDRATRIELIDRARETRRLVDWPLRLQRSVEVPRRPSVP